MRGALPCAVLVTRGGRLGHFGYRPRFGPHAGGLSRSDVARFAAVPTVVSRPARAARSRCACRISPATSRASSNATVPIPRLSRASTLALTSARPSPRRMPAVLRSWRFRNARSRLANTRPCRSSRPWWAPVPQINGRLPTWCARSRSSITTLTQTMPPMRWPAPSVTLT